jgi:transposase
MSKRIFTKEQIGILMQNPNVARCSEKSVSYRMAFKALAVKQHREGMPSSEIFRQAKFNIGIIGRNTPRGCLRSWRNIFRDKGEAGLKTDGRGQSRAGGRPKSIAGLTDKEKLKRLEAEVAYLKEENRFLAKLRKESLN